MTSTSTLVSTRRSTFSRLVGVSRREVLAGLVGAFALMPESISFAVVAGLNPLVGLLTAATMAMAIAVVGGRPAMVSGAAGSVALVVAPLSRHHGLPYLIAAVILGGILQVVLGLCRVDRLMRVLPRSVITGFVNALAILIFWAQIPELSHVPWVVYPLVCVGLTVVVVAGRVNNLVPAPLLAILVVTAIAVTGHLAVPTLGQKGNLAAWHVPHPALPALPWTWATLGLVAPYAVALAVVGLLESLMTAQLVDEITSSASSPRRECCGQGVANLVTALLGGMGGCAMIGQTIINLRTGGRTRLSTFTAGAAILVMVSLVASQLGRVPMAALVAVMIVVAFRTFDWGSVRPATLKTIPRRDTAATVATVAGTLATSDLAIGVAAGVVVFAAATRLGPVYDRLSARRGEPSEPAPVTSS